MTGQTTKVIIGEQIPLSASYTLPQGVSVQSQSWTLSGVPVSGFTANSTTGSYPSVNDLSSGSVTFYWITAGTWTVTYSMTLSTGDNLTATATFNCVARGASITATTSSVNVGLSSLPYFGSNALYFNSNSGTAGISFSQTVTVPGGFSGITEWLQFVESSATRHSSGGAQNRNLPGGCLDTTYPYSTSASTRDSPAQQLNSPYDSYTRADTFTMFLMFQPTGGIFVPIRLVNWSWSGAASLSGGTWVGANRSWTSNPGDAAPSWNPTWTCNAANYLNSWQ